MSDSNRLQVSIIREVTLGTTPSSALDVIPITGGGMPEALETVRSATMRSDKQRGATKKILGAGGAAYDFEMAVASYDELLRGAIYADSDFPTAVAISDTNIAAVTSGNKFTKADNWTGANIVVGQWVYVDGFTGNTANNGWHQVIALSTTDLTVRGITLVDDAAGETVTVKGSSLLNGTTQASYSVQQNYVDQTNLWHNLLGARIDGLSLDVSSGAIISGNVAFTALSRNQAGATIGSGAPTAAAGNTPISEADGFGKLSYAYTHPSYDVSAVSFQVGTAARPRKPLGSQAYTQIQQNALEVSGSLEVYLEDGTWALDTALGAFTKNGMAFDIVQGTNRYHVHFPQIVFTGEPNDLGGVDSDIMLSLAWEAEVAAHYTGGAEHTVQITRI
jgi:hypothetical protein